MKRLQTWLRKHQDETLPDGSKNQLLVSVQTYYKLALQEPELKVHMKLDPSCGEALGLIVSLLCTAGVTPPVQPAPCSRSPRSRWWMTSSSSQRASSLPARAKSEENFAALFAMW